MAWQLSPYVLPSFLAGLIALVVAGFAWRHRSERAASPFVVFMLGSAWWAVAYGIELGFSDLASIVLWDKLAFVGSVIVPAAFFWLAVEYASFDDELPTWTPVVLVVEPVVTLALVWTYPSTTLVWESVTLVQSGPLVLPVIDFGPWYWINAAYSYVLIGSGLVFIGIVFVRGNRIYRRQAALLLIGAILPIGANLLYNVFPAASPFPAIDMTTFAMVFTGVFYGLGLFQFQMLDFVPVARGMLLGEVGDGYVVTNDGGVFVDGNAVGWAVVAGDSGYFEADAATDDERSTVDGRIVSVTVDGTERSYEMRIRPITDFRDEEIGTLLIFRDITELEVIRQHEQRVAVMNRILRHNIRNSVNVIEGYGRLLVGRLDGEERAYAERIAERAARMTSISEKARHVSEHLTGPGRREPVDVGPVVSSVIERLSAAYPDASVSLTGSEPATALLAGEEALDLALEYLLENAIEHNDADDPTVAVGVGGESEVEIVIADNGPGIPHEELAALDADVETPLEHGSGLGLWIVHWIVARSGGHLEVEATEPRGSAVTIRLPSAE